MEEKEIEWLQQMVNLEDEQTLLKSLATNTQEILVGQSLKKI